MEQLKSFFEKLVPFNQFLGITVDQIDSGTCQMRAPYQEQFIGDPIRPSLHGGLISTLADAAGGLAVFSKLMDPTVRLSTIDMRVDFLRPANLEDLICDAHILRLGSHVAVTQMVVKQKGDYIAAECRGVYSIHRLKVENG
jgi:uncharacterized protein (TIGR00369 family)